MKILRMVLISILCLYMYGIAAYAILIACGIVDINTGGW